MLIFLLRHFIFRHSKWGCFLFSSLPLEEKKNRCMGHRRHIVVDGSLCALCGSCGKFNFVIAWSHIRQFRMIYLHRLRRYFRKYHAHVSSRRPHFISVSSWRNANTRPICNDEKNKKVSGSSSSWDREIASLYSSSGWRAAMSTKTWHG